MTIEQKKESLENALKNLGFDERFFIYVERSKFCVATTIKKSETENYLSCISPFLSYSELNNYILGVYQSKKYFK